MSVGEKSVVFLLGAGCSYDANVPVSKTMIEKLERLLCSTRTDDLYPLYKYVKYTMEYGSRLADQSQDFNIESLLVTLHTLSEYKRTHLYPFITGYTYDLLEYAGQQFKNINELIRVIEKELPGWVTLASYRPAAYYKGFQRFQEELNYALRIFSLNYDLCLEENVDCKLETGFEDDKPWDGSRFIQAEDDEETAIYLYKLHGSINWVRENGQLRTSAQQNISPDVIFGTDIKMQAIDPYLFYLYEFRKYVLLSQIIISIGYSYSDKHINDLIRQAMKNDPDKKLMIVSPTHEEKNKRDEICNKIEFTDCKDRIIIVSQSAKTFLEQTITVDFVSRHLPQGDPLPF